MVTLPDPARVVEVVCSDRGQHGRMGIATLVRTDDGVEELRWRAAGDTHPVEGRQRATRVLHLTPTSRDDHAGRKRFRFRCDGCGLDKPMTGATLLPIVDAYSEAGTHAMDLSRLP